MQLTTDQIVQYIEGGAHPDSFEWQIVLEVTATEEERDAVDAARFLETLCPGREWYAGEYHGLMHNHFTGRYASAAEIGEIRATEKFQDEQVTFKDDVEALARSAERFAARTADDAAAEKYLRSNPSTYVYEARDGSVLVFDDLADGDIELVVSPF